MTTWIRAGYLGGPANGGIYQGPARETIRVQPLPRDLVVGEPHDLVTHVYRLHESHVIHYTGGPVDTTYTYVHEAPWVADVRAVLADHPEWLEETWKQP